MKRIELFIFAGLFACGVLLAPSPAPPAEQEVLRPSAAPPRRVPERLTVAAYNVRRLGEKGKDLDALARVIRNFDICGLVEVQDEKSLALLAARLRSLTRRPWGFMYGEATRRPGGSYTEAYGVVWRRDRAQTGDGVMGNVWDPGERFRHDPFMASFKRGNFDFTLILLHTRWTNDKHGSRRDEVMAAAALVNRLRKRGNEKDFILMGDFNYSATSRILRDMAERGNLRRLTPGEPTTFKRDNSGYAHAYDHIYASRNTAEREFVPGLSRALDVTRYLYGDAGTESMARSKRNVSDHLPVWAAFHVTASDDD